MLLLPFTNLLNVKAEGVTITTDESKTLASDKNFEYVTNTAKLTIDDRSETGTFVAYKTLDVYYNKFSNEMTYDFTADFKAFLAQLPEDDSFKDLTIANYQELTDGSYTEDNNTLTLNKLVSKYATYLKKVKNITGIDSFVVDENDKRDSTAEVEVGSYLILPSEIVEKIEMADEGFRLRLYTYMVSVGNVVFTAGNDGWELLGKMVFVKNNHTTIRNWLFHANSDELIEILMGENEESLKKIQNDVTYSASKELYLFVNWDGSYRKAPTNTNSSILSNDTLMKKIGQREYVFPKGITYDGLYTLAQTDTGIGVVKIGLKNGSIYFDKEDDSGNSQEARFADVINNTAENKLILTNLDLSQEPWIFMKLKIDNNINVGSTTVEDDLVNYGNKITTNISYLKDAYVDITGMDQATAESAVLGTGVWDNTIYTHGVTVTNKAGSDTLNGAKFQVYLDKDCTTEVGEEFEITENGTYTFKGLNDTDTYYLKQTKAPTGYRLLTETVELNPTNLNKEVGLYNVEIANTKMGLLPSTGGLGTILYTTFGLLIIVVGSIAFVSYRKKQLQNN